MIQSIFNFDNINFNGGNISCDGGSILLLSFLKKYNLLSSLDDIPFNDTRRLPKYSNSDIVTQIVLRNLLGYFNQADQMTLIDDPLLSQCINACSQPTLSRFFDRINMKTNMTIKEHIQRLGCDYVNRHVENIILDVDSTKTQTHGHQEASAYIYHYGVNGYHPMMINEYNTKLLLSSNFRTGAAYSSNGFINELKEVLAHLDRKGKAVSMRGDSAFYNTEFMDYMHHEDIQYYIRAKSYEKIQNMIIEHLEDNGIDYLNYTNQEPYYGEIEYSPKNLSTPCRYVFKVFPAQDKQLTMFPVIYCIITNDMKRSCEDICDFYEERGNSENFTKELKDDFNGDNVGHHDFEKNCFQFMISSLCYNFYHLFRILVLEGKDQKIRMNTFRNKYQKIAVKVIRHARRIILSFSSTYRYKKKFLKYYQKLQN